MDKVAEVRSFNRFYTAHVGALGEAYLDSPYGLTEARVLYELARGEVSEPGLVAERLGLDPSYLSRILTRFERDGLLERRRADHDARRRVLRLTAAGLARGRDLDERSTSSVRNVLDGLSERASERLVTAMRTVRAVLAETPAPETPATGPQAGPVAGEQAGRERTTPTLVLREPKPGDLGWVVSRNGALYAEEYGWDQTYEALVARIVGDFGADHDPALERAWVATLDGDPVGFVMCVRAAMPEGSDQGPEPGSEARLRLLLVEPHARGRGVGSALVEECVRFARTAGYSRLTLWTNDPLTAARRIYDRAGFRLMSEHRHTSFGHAMTGQILRLDL